MTQHAAMRQTAATSDRAQQVRVCAALTSDRSMQVAKAAAGSSQERRHTGLAQRRMPGLLCHKERKVAVVACAALRQEPFEDAGDAHNVPLLRASQGMSHNASLCQLGSLPLALVDRYLLADTGTQGADKGAHGCRVDVRLHEAGNRCQRGQLHAAVGAQPQHLVPELALQSWNGSSVQGVGTWLLGQPDERVAVLAPALGCAQAASGVLRAAEY